MPRPLLMRSAKVLHTSLAASNLGTASKSFAMSTVSFTVGPMKCTTGSVDVSKMSAAHQAVDKHVKVTRLAVQTMHLLFSTLHHRRQHNAIIFFFFFVQDGMVLGIGSGSTIVYGIQRLGKVIPLTRDRGFYVHICWARDWNGVFLEQILSNLRSYFNV